MSNSTEAITPEMQAQIDALTGKSAAGGGPSIPIIKVNYQGGKDLEGNKVERGHFVLGQKMEGKKLAVAGVDLGAELNGVILKAARQYSFYDQNDSKKSCNSQLVWKRNERFQGVNLKYDCQSGECPHRAEGVSRDEKCTCQHVLFILLPEGTVDPDGNEVKVARLFAKGASFMPVAEYISSASNLLAVVSTVYTEEEQNGSIIYYVTHIRKGKDLPQKQMLQNLEIATDLDKTLETAKASRAELPAGGGQGQKALPHGGTAVRKQEAAPEFADGDDIPW
jgi:hypothetical protein